MKACFVCERHDQIPFVYGEERIKRIKDRVTLYDKIIDKQNLSENKALTVDCEIVFSTWNMSTLSGDEIDEYFPNLKIIFFAAGSVRYFAKPFLERGIKVVNASRAMAKPVAQFTLSLIIQLSKGSFISMNNYVDHDWMEARWITFDYFPGLYQKTKIGILGCGRIGQTVIEYLKPFDVQVLVYDPFLSDEDAKRLNVKKTTLEDIFTNCQVISNHIANNKETENILNYSLFSLMSDTASFINTGRGAQVVEKDLARALSEKPLRFAALDVTTNEPYPFDGVLRKLKNVLLFPHIAGYAHSEVHCLSDCVLKQFDNFLDGKEIENTVTLDMLKIMA